MKCYNGISVHLRILSIIVKTYPLGIYGIITRDLTVPSDCVKKYQQSACHEQGTWAIPRPTSSQTPSFGWAPSAFQEQGTRAVPRRRVPKLFLSVGLLVLVTNKALRQPHI